MPSTRAQGVFEELFDDTEIALEIQVPFLSSISVLIWILNMEQIKKYT